MEIRRGRSHLRPHPRARCVYPEFTWHCRESFAQHETVNHSNREYNRDAVHVSSADGFNSLTLFRPQLS
ncbi:hypothetical protein GA829_34765 (plasmid) [Mesorhizobium sp. INR15]|nr:hypothetical protein GA829_34765 [Mesorhizobium sp. INR15]